MSSNLQLIIKREFIARVRNRTFIVMTFLSPLIVVGMVALISWLATINNDEIKKIAFVDETELFITDLKNTDEVEYINYSNFDLETAKDSVISKKLYGLLYIPKKSSNKELSESIQFYAEESPNFSILNTIEGIIANKITKQNYKAEGLDLNIIENSKARINIRIENFFGEKTSKMSNYIKMAFGGFAGYLLMMFIIIYGNMVMRSVIEEKTNRIIEIIISSVKPMQLMMGKILGTSFAGILQFLIWVLLGGVLLLVATSLFGIDPQPGGVDPSIALQGNNQQELQLLMQDVLNLPLLTLVISFFVYFIGGYFLYSSIYAAIGAAVDSETDSQQFMLPIILPLMLGIYVGFFAVIENPHGTVSTVFSMIPLTSPIVMLMRIPFGVPWWEILISIILLIGSIIFMIWFAGKIYRIGILMYGKKPSYKELFKWLKY
ncbi:ABC transporter permease [uncultured Aquimarina sp.]|uniref:ABC transporter permease n=1 Tax=uncultured Aquimarina sp. TaxID=575652 RepID=UPI0026167556|nr:ABC transporter permease [uncultured Aquimarina sp.]